jgi:hypothetical protein
MTGTEPIDLKSARWQHALDNHITKPSPPSTRTVLVRYVQTPWCQGVVLVFVTVIILCAMSPPIVQTNNPRNPIEKGRLSGFRVTVISVIVFVVFVFNVCFVM